MSDRSWQVGIHCRRCCCCFILGKEDFLSSPGAPPFFHWLLSPPPPSWDTSIFVISVVTVLWLRPLTSPRYWMFEIPKKLPSQGDCSVWDSSLIVEDVCSACCRTPSLAESRLLVLTLNCGFERFVFRLVLQESTERKTAWLQKIYETIKPVLLFLFNIQVSVEQISV